MTENAPWDTSAHEPDLSETGTWELYYNGERISPAVGFARMEEISITVSEMFANRMWGWLDLDFAEGDATTFHRLLISPGVHVSFRRQEI